MARSKATFGKKEKEKKKLQKRKEKEQRKEERKANAAKSFEDMIAYTDEYGNIISEPPDPTKKKEVIKESDMVIGARNIGSDNKIDLKRTGRVTFFNDGKGYGFIKDLDTKESVFVHIDNLMNPIKEHDKVTFEMAKGPKGPIAVKVALAE